MDDPSTRARARGQVISFATGEPLDRPSSSVPEQKHDDPDPDVLNAAEAIYRLAKSGQLRSLVATGFTSDDQNMYLLVGRITRFSLRGAIDALKDRLNEAIIQAERPK